MSDPYTSVVGIKPPNDKFIKMKKIWDVCSEAGVSIPKEVEEFFNGEAPDEKGVIIDIKLFDAYKNIVRTWDDGDMKNGLEVDLTKLPKDITILRFINSY